MQIKHIAFLVIPEVTLLDITGPYEVFSQLNEYFTSTANKPNFAYELHTLSVNKQKKIRTASGLVIECENTINNVNYNIDTLFIPGVPNSLQNECRLSKKVLGWIKEQALQVRRLCSVCTGTFILAETGLLNGKKATTHWEKCEILSRNYPDIRVDESPIFIKDGNIYTSAGISSGMDLALALVEEDYGKSLALEVARQMVLYLKRPGSQSQYSTVLSYQHIDYKPILEIANWIQDHISETLTVELLATRASMSARNFARVFARETGITPAKFIDKLRIESACRYLTDSDLSLKEIANLCGLGSADNMRKIFIKHIKISPSDYRRNFGTTVV